MNDLTGLKFGRWTVIRGNHNKNRSHSLWDCECDCGNKSTILGGNLSRGKTKSCGCFRSMRTKENSTKHGHRYTTTYATWISMKARCYDPNQQNYQYYGGRGITVCKRWHDFESFLADMGEKPDGFTIERINNENGYFPENCKWETHKINCRNTRLNRLIEYEGMVKCIAVWSEESGIPYKTLWKRLKTHTPQVAFAMQGKAAA